MGVLCCGCAGKQNGQANKLGSELSNNFLADKLNFRPGTFKDRVYGSILGALLGSAYGASVDQMERELTNDEVKTAMTMPGGGSYSVAPGQVSDCGELTMCLLKALVDSN